MFRWLLLIGLVITTNAYSMSVTAQSWLVADETGKVLQSENELQVRSIASISKLIMAMVVLDAKQDPNQKIGKFTRDQLIQLSLVKSDNSAAQALCNAYPTAERGCVQAMNTKVKFLGLTNTKFVEPTGLSVFNVSTARDLVTIVHASQFYPEILKAAKTSEIKIKIKKKWLVFRNTNPIIGHNHTIIVSKTGYIKASGGCIVMMLDTEVGRRIVVVLGSKNTHTRIPEAEFIAKRF